MMTNLSVEVLMERWGDSDVRPASEKDLATLLPNFAGPVAMGVVEQIKWAQTTGAINNVDFWEVINTVNKRALMTYGFEDDEIELLDSEYLAI